MATRQPALPPNRAFLHLCNDHRWLVRAADNWRRLKGGSPEHAQTVSMSHKLLPNIDVSVLSSALQYSRALIEFYTPADQPDETDIIVSDFGTSVSAGTESDLRKYKPSIEVHLLHLTAWRDVEYRANHRADPRKKNLDYGEERQRMDWNKEIPVLADLLAKACDEAASNASDWKVPLVRLAKAIRELERDPSSWPTELTEKADVAQYLRGFGFAP